MQIPANVFVERDLPRNYLGKGKDFPHLPHQQITNEDSHEGKSMPTCGVL